MWTNYQPNHMLFLANEKRCWDMATNANQLLKQMQQQVDFCNQLT